MTDEHRWYLVTRKRTEGFIASAFRKLRQEGIEPILIKGWAAARNYPDGQTRFLGDIDLAVRADVYDKSVRLVYDQADPITGVDLHRELRTLDTLDWETLFERSNL
ncbi:MAG TPA: nucleotidyltransferase family protein, partial [Pyrinomonadaceae bacterium]|nr:nucleotidyltransferase family protein [Pyrinomonadaceae bacterium]